ncbi:hypothetical protein J7T55_009117 [Diaporthe amygdali]|uniref:uncharacterized protein n=1 Tax=Phomopsis amygdali TaxID=1214568 RepID=UPI0022FE8D15|nr:uncharacterized protein J7T55_009117 [Diaporthe amygdali]KAJ0118334.1 hypothetical protein J7T55_009117 [Diaporthe amygdali]
MPTQIQQDDGSTQPKNTEKDTENIRGSVGTEQTTAYSEHPTLTHFAKSPFYALCGDEWVLNAKQLWLAAEMGLIALPKVTERHIQDKNKTQGISTSQSEAVALAYAVCAVFTYILQ